MLPGINKANVESLVQDQHCYLIRNCLSPSDQSTIYQDILNRSKNTDNTTNASTCMYPGPKTIIFGGNQSTLKFTGDDNDNVYNQLIVRNANASLQTVEEARQLMSNKVLVTDADADGQNIADKTKSTLSVGVIRYTVPNGNFPEHIDHCNDNSWVYLLSLGCSANFVVGGGQRHCCEKKKLMFQFNSGDVLVFDPSSEAAIVHGVKSINEHESDADFCMMNGNDCMPKDFGRYRFGVQCRVKLEAPTQRSS